MNDVQGNDLSDELLASVAQASEQQQPMYINGAGSKRHVIGRDCEAPVLNVDGHRGILDYESAELVITARAGTPLKELVEVLDSQQQMMAFEPPLFDNRATLGGTLACNLSGPSRPWGGSIRDAVLGVQLINGKAELLNFGGKVMKNVAGYDVSRLQAGALGTLGILTRISLKVVPRPEQECSLVYEMPAEQAIETMNRRASEAKPLSGAYWLDERLHLRLSGAATAVEHTARHWGGERGIEPDWEALKEMSLPFFQGDAPLWRFSVKSTAAHESQLGNTLIDWGGAQRWIRGSFDADELRASAQRGKGHVILFRGGDRRGDVRQTPGRVEQRLQRRLKQAFDPNGILNPGRMYGDLQER